MGRIRTIKPEFWTNEKLSELPEATHMFAAALLNYVDDEGYFNANPGLVRAAIYPLREPSRGIPVMLQELSGIGYVRLGSGDDGRIYGQVVNFTDHQRINKASKSKLKDIIRFANPPVGLPESSRSPPVGLPHGTGNREQGSGTGNREQGDVESRKSAREVLARVNEKLALGWRSPHAFLLGRLNGGATVEDCVAVVEFKAAEWKGTDQEQYVRQKTLFRESNFEGYLHAARAASSKKQSEDDRYAQYDALCEPDTETDEERYAQYDAL